MIVDLADRKDLAESWGFEWAKMAEGRLETDTYYGEIVEEEVASFFNYMGILPEDLRGKVVLDAGCGCGRLTRELGKYAAQVYGIDIASSISCIHEYCEEAQNVRIIQADIIDPPFKDASFDLVFCKLAVCYVHQPEQAFSRLSTLVKPGGRLFVSVPDKASLAFVVKLKDLLRIAHRMPRELLLYISWGLAPLLSLAKRVSGNPATSLRANAFFLFNALHPSFMTRHTLEEVEGWFERGGFHEITPVTNGMPHLVHVRGTRS
jgi:SAM-dependent methyltransferase